MIFSNICYGCSYVFYNSYLPLLADSRQEVRAKMDEGATPEEINNLRSDLQNEMSSKAMALGYFAGLIITFLCVPIILMMDNTGVTTWSASRY